MDPRLGTALAVVIGVPAVLVGYIYLTEVALRWVPERSKARVRPWLWLLPALLFLTLFLVIRTILTIIRSLQDAVGGFVGLDNFAWFFGTPDAVVAVRNNLLWVIC